MRRPIPPIVPIVEMPANRRYSTASMPPDFAMMQNPVAFAHPPQHQQQWGMPQQMMQPMAPQRSSLSIGTGSDMFAIFEASPTSATPPFLSPNSTTTTTSQDDGWDVNAAHVFDTNRSEEHTSELKSLTRISYAFFCLNKKK